jgi:UDP-2,4-diacetamido-2,4,6-trideoxy-beta-L-altropyranose hydrolase
MRCIALAQAWQDQGGEITFISHCESEALREKIQIEGFRFISLDHACPDSSDLMITLSILKNESDDQKSWLVLDGYHYTPEYQKAIRDEGILLLVIDDINHLPYYHADILLNQNIYAPELNYNCDEDTTLLLGPRYVLLRRDFLKYRNFMRQVPERARNILITLGGADPDNVTLKVVEVLQLLDNQEIKVKIIIGPANRHLDSLSKALASAGLTVELLTNPPNMPELMTWADLAVTAGGSTCWELAFMGCSVIAGRIAGIEDLLIKRMGSLNLLVDTGWFRQLVTKEFAHLLTNCMMDKEWRFAVGQRGAEVIDGFGYKRVIETMLEYIV